MGVFTRSEFLRLSAAAAAGAALVAAGCGGSPQAPPQNGRLSSPTASTGRPRLAVARGADPAAVTAAAIAVLGGMDRFVRTGAEVVIKPNICSGYHGPEYAATTNPQVVAALVSLCRRAGAARVRVMDSPFGSTAAEAYRVSGIQAAVEGAGGVMELMTPARFQTYTIPNGRHLTDWPVYRDILTCDVLINVPILKQHGLTRLTLGGKNLLGVVLRPNELHGAIGQDVADLLSLCRPTLTVVDAIRALTAHGPTGGDLTDVERLDTVVAGTDPVAADAFAATLLDVEPHEVPYVAAAHRMGLGELDLDRVQLLRVRA